VQLTTIQTAAPQDEYYEQLERGDILFFPSTPFSIEERDRDLLRTSELSNSSHHKNIAYRPASDKLTGFDAGAVSDPERLKSVLRTYSERSLAFLRSFLPRYMQDCRIDYASFRPLEEEGRDLPTKKRNDLLHVDAFPTRPTGGDLILRLFTNIHATKVRVWLTSDPFESLARAYAVDAGLSGLARRPNGPAIHRLLGMAGLPVVQRTAYDRFMLGFHDYLKFNEGYQQSCAKYRFEFPPNSTWIVFTDIVPHAVLSGQYALEQTVIVRRARLLNRERAPIEILQSLCKRPLAPPAVSS
jgi:hypothetical protein